MTTIDTPTASTTAAAPERPSVLDSLRRPHVVRDALGGFGPAVLAVILLLLMLVLAPSVAPEKIVEKPAPVGTPAPGTTAPVTVAP